MVEVFYLSKKKKSRSKIYLSRECVNFMNLDLGRQTLHDPSGLQVLILQHPYGFSGGARNAVCYPL